MYLSLHYALTITVALLSTPIISLHIAGDNTLSLNPATITPPPGCANLAINLPGNDGTDFAPIASCTWQCPPPRGEFIGSAITYSLFPGTYTCPAHFIYSVSTRYPNITFVRDDNAATYPPTSIPMAMYDCSSGGISLQYNASIVRDPRTSNNIPSGTWTCAANPVAIPGEIATVVLDATDSEISVPTAMTTTANSAVPGWGPRARRAVRTGVPRA